MTRINQQDVPLMASGISDEISHSFSEGVSQLSVLVQDPKYTMESDAAILNDLASQSQTSYAKAHTRVLQPPDWLGQTSEVMKTQAKGSNTWREVIAASTLSADQYILQLSAIRRQTALQSQLVNRAKEMNERMASSKSETTSAMKAFIKTFPRESQLLEVKDDGGDMSVDSLSSQFECDIKGVARSIVKFQDDHFTTFRRDVQQVLGRAETGIELTRSIDRLGKDSGLIMERLQAGNEFFQQ
ncbi:MAG: hypothetical protein J3Q66DRAFT_356592 [Benniella sp.]|nr:MAG: hypothetical protein J3Q66DRAFT_356592 [Benniella sp.]